MVLILFAVLASPDEATTSTARSRYRIESIMTSTSEVEQMIQDDAKSEDIVALAFVRTSQVVTVLRHVAVGSRPRRENLLVMLGAAEVNDLDLVSLE